MVCACHSLCSLKVTSVFFFFCHLFLRLHFYCESRWDCIRPATHSNGDSASLERRKAVLSNMFTLVIMANTSRRNITPCLHFLLCTQTLLNNPYFTSEFCLVCLNKTKHVLCDNFLGLVWLFASRFFMGFRGGALGGSLLCLMYFSCSLYPISTRSSKETERGGMVLLWLGGPMLRSLQIMERTSAPLSCPVLIICRGSTCSF